MTIIKTREIYEEIRLSHKAFFANFELKNNRKIKLGVIQIGGNKASESYINIKNKYAQRVGVNLILHKFEVDESEEDLILKIKNINKNTDGVILQLPINRKFDIDKLLECISDGKDIDKLKLQNKVEDIKLNRFVSPVVFGFIKIFEKLNLQMQSKKVVILGRGKLVGQPLSGYLQQQNIGFKIYNKNDNQEEILEAIKSADFLFTGIGKANFIQKEMIKENSVVIDAGTSEDGDSLAGDVSVECAQVVNLLITTPGGIGPLTVCGLFENLKIATENSR